MIYVALFLSVIFASVGFIVTKSNAKYILSGYNTLSEADRANVNINGYLNYFRRFHFVMGISLFAGTLLISLFNNNWASIFMITFPLAAYSYMVIQGQSYIRASGSKRLTSNITAGILMLIAIFIGFVTIRDSQSSELILNKETIEIKGSYGITIRKQEINSVRLVKDLPPISYKQNGFAAGDYAKGSFKIKNGQVVKMFVNKNGNQFLLLDTTNGNIYYNSDEIDINELEKRIRQWQGAN